MPSPAAKKVPEAAADGSGRWGCTRTPADEVAQSRQGATLEPALGSGRYALLLGELLILSQTLLVLLARSVAAAAPVFAASYYSVCAVGFSGVLFALKVGLLSSVLSALVALQHLDKLALESACPV